jgi:hypothetical protein
MWIVKGLSLGFGMFVIGFVIYVLAMMRQIAKGSTVAPGGVVGVDMVSLYHSVYPWVYIALVATLALGLALIRCWPQRPA